MNVFRALLYSLLYIVFVELVSIWQLAGMALWGTEFNPDPYVHFVNGALAFIGVFLFMNLSGRFKLADLKAKTVFYPLAIVLGFGFLFLQVPLNFIFNEISGSHYQIAFEFEWANLITLSSFSALLFIPITEELFFRQFIQGGLARNYPAWLALVLSALLFAFIHLGLGSALMGYGLNWHLAYQALFGGLISSGLFFFSKSVGPSILFHISWNLAVILF